MELSVCVTDDDYEAWRAIRMAVVPDERCGTVAELREHESFSSLMLLATLDGAVVGSGTADRSETAGGGYAAPRVLLEYRRRGVGPALLRALADHCTELGLPVLRAAVEDEESMAFAAAFGFVEVDREVEQVRPVGDEEPPDALPAEVAVVILSDRPELWAFSFEAFGTEVLADFAVHSPLEISAEEWDSTWRGDPMFLALHEGQVIDRLRRSQPRRRPSRPRRERPHHRTPGLARPRRRPAPQATHAALGGGTRRPRALH